MEYPLTARLGLPANDKGAYTCIPDKTYRWEHGKNFVEAKLLWLANHKVAYGVDHFLKDGGQSGPIFYDEKDSNYNHAVSGNSKTIASIIEQAEALKIPEINALREWAKGIHEPDNWRSALGSDLDETGALIVVRGQMDSAARAVAQQVGYQLPADSTNPDLICKDIAANMRRSVEAVLDIGRALLVLKAACAHGQFIERTSALGMELRLAQRFMQSALKFSNASTSTHLLKQIDTTSKLFELLVLDDEQINELTETGQTGDLKLDDVACMGIRELRQKLRDARQKADAKDQVISAKNTENDALREKLAERQTPPPDEVPSLPTTEFREKLGQDIQNARGAIYAVYLSIRAYGKGMPAAESPDYDGIKQAAFLELLAEVRQCAMDTGTPLNLGQYAAEILIDENAAYHQ